MTTKPIDYSKWDHIEISDDEDDVHPNIDKASLFRWRHQARVEREAEEKAKKEKLKQQHEEAEKKKKDLENKLKEVAPVDPTKAEELKQTLSEAEKQALEFARKEAELERMEREHPKWNVDNISKPGFDKTFVNKDKGKSAKSEEKSPEQEAKSMKNFIKQNESRIKKYGMYTRNEDTQKYLAENLDLVCEETANYLVIWCLELEMAGKHELMVKVAHQTILIQYILQLAKTVERDPRETVNRFFAKLKVAEREYQDAFDDELSSFIKRVEERAKVRLAEAEEEVRKEEEEEKKKRLGPGGLDPYEVIETLPQSLRDAFESRDTAKLKEAIAALPIEEAKYHMKRCEDSGLWVPQKGSSSVDTAEDSGEDDGEVFDEPSS